jgi:hypothetical protein
LSSGKIIINGAKSEAETLDSARMYQAQVTHGASRIAWRVTRCVQLTQARMPSGGTLTEEMMNIANMVGRSAELSHAMLPPSPLNLTCHIATRFSRTMPLL